ncbi:uncharacterized protein HD556DRAFT_1330598 [Suillus plorans]|uniref:Uncharacterized protein n=1 Tax=Suillus plorans TaxID=116603 RepID=A0A9P7DVC1_9AGAM|nr:uncharacterized protein HD556DRAFT_1330598 [Suillus plorans]KAG1803837.1 hypothetical protein HD556DRAFT_1330598 [Suillus plorans]
MMSHAPIQLCFLFTPLRVMATKTFDDRASSVSDKPPPYDPISTSVSVDSVRCKRSVFSFPQSKRASVLSRIREIVSSPDFTLSSVAPIITSCAAALRAAEFSSLIQEPNIEDHTALYWTIINNRREALWEFTKFISKFSPACSSDLRLACMIVNDHDLFMQLKLGDNVDPEDGSLRRMLSCPRDEIKVSRHGSSEANCPPDDLQVHEGHGMGENYFFARFVFRMFQKRLRIRQKLAVEFVAQGRIWVLRFCMESKGSWCVQYGLSEPSLPVYPNTKLAIQAHSRPPYSSCATQRPLLLDLTYLGEPMVPEGSLHHYRAIEPKKSIIGFQCILDDWLMNDDTPYVDCEGTLIAGLTVMIK